MKFPRKIPIFSILMYFFKISDVAVFGENQGTVDLSVRCSQDGSDGVTCRTSYHGPVRTSGERPVPPLIPADCSEVFEYFSTSDGVYSIKPIGWTGPAFEVFCDMSNGGGWTVFQRRQDNSVDFYRDWGSYKHGFGDLRGNFWLGNAKIHSLTNQSNYEMRIDIVDRHGVSLYLRYDLFRIGDEEEKYRLNTLGGFSGNTGYDYMNRHRGMYFTTRDRDHDARSSSCAEELLGAWWYRNCYTANLNGVYGRTDSKGVALYNTDTSAYQYNLQYTDMKIRLV